MYLARKVTLIPCPIASLFRNLAENNFSGQVPLTIVRNAKLMLKYCIGNPNICSRGNNSCIVAISDVPKRRESSETSNKRLITSLVASGVALLLLTAMERRGTNSSGAAAEDKKSDAPRSFSYSEVRTATQNFINETEPNGTSGSSISDASHSNFTSHGLTSGDWSNHFAENFRGRLELELEFAFLPVPDQYDIILQQTVGCKFFQSVDNKTSRAKLPSAHISHRVTHFLIVVGHPGSGPGPFSRFLDLVLKFHWLERLNISIYADHKVEVASHTRVSLVGTGSRVTLTPSSICPRDLQCKATA
eukprot:Gb_40654 [translate_table: standard]